MSDVCISVITKAELLFGVETSSRRPQDEAALGAFLAYVGVLDFPDHQRSVHCGACSQPRLDSGNEQHA